MLTYIAVLTREGRRVLTKLTRMNSHEVVNSYPGYLHYQIGLSEHGANVISATGAVSDTGAMVHTL